MEKKDGAPSELEQKSYALLFLVLCLLLILFSLWVFKWESVDLRPWKKYQKEYINLTVKRLKTNLIEQKRKRSNQEFNSRYVDRNQQRIKTSYIY